MVLVADLRIKLDDSKQENWITLHRNYGEWFHLRHKSVVTLQFGARHRKVRLRLSKDIQPNEMIMTKKMRDSLSIPTFCGYQLVKQKEKIILGPFIGIAMKEKKGTLNFKKLEGYARVCKSMKGAVLAFSPSRVNVKGKEIDGYTYDPDHNEWKSGVYGYPGAVVKLDRIHPIISASFTEELKGRIFNTRRLNKLQMFQCLRQFPSLRLHLPVTIQLRKFEDVLGMLDQYKEIYIKPMVGSGGKGIFKISKTPGWFVVSQVKHHPTSEDAAFRSWKEVSSYLAKQLEGKRYIVQQGIRMLEENGRIVDFRCVIVKNGEGQWEEIGLIARFSRIGCIVSNVTAGGSAQNGDAVLHKLLPMDENQIKDVRREISALAVETVTSLEASGGHWGNIGLDFACEPDGKLWLIEVNHNHPDHTIALDAGDVKMYRKTMEAIMQYARRLAEKGRE